MYRDLKGAFAMPVLLLECPDCKHQYSSLVLTGTQSPKVWVCSKCGGEAVAPKAGSCGLEHPWENSNPYRTACPCCGL